MGVYVYMLRCADDSYYVGSATGDDLSARVDQHNAGSRKGYTFSRRPVVLVWSEYFDRITDGIAVERQLKGWSRAKKRGAATFRLGQGEGVIPAPWRSGKADLTIHPSRRERAPQDDVGACGSLPQRRAQRLREFIVGAVEPQRRHRDVTRCQRRKIGVLRRHVDLRQPFKSDPEIRIAAAVAALVDLEKAEIALALPRHAYARDILGRTGRKVDVDHGVLGHAGIDHLAQNLRPEFQRGVPLRCVAGLHAEFLRQRKRRQSQNGAFQSAGDGAGIDHVFGDVTALVDAGQHQIRHGFAEDVARAHDDAIGRRAPHREMARADFAQPQGIVQRQRMRDAGLIEFRRHYPDVIGQCAGDLLDNLQAGSMDAIVIGTENSHPFKCLVRSIPPAVKAPSYPSHAAEANPAMSGKMASRRLCAEGVTARTASALFTAL